MATSTSTQKKVFDFSAYADPKADSIAGAWLHLPDPYDLTQLMYADEAKTLPCRLKLYGPESDQVRAFQNEVQRLQRSGEDITEDADTALVAAIVKDWENIGIGADTTCTKENVIALLSRYKSYKTRIALFAITLKNFKGSANKP
jgi:hypothetical protein